MLFCAPIVCCTRSKEPKKRDECMCGFGYLNGGLQIATAQCFLILGSFLSVASLGDCSFVKIDEDLRFVLGPTKTSNTFGYLTFEDASDGRCYWYDDGGGGATSQQQLESYWDFLGSDFTLTRIFAMIGAGAGWLQFLYSITLCCSSHSRNFRDLQFFLVSIVLTLFQGLTFLIFNSDFCEEYSCTFGRSAGFSGAACACYFIAGTMYRAMSDYPGHELVDRSSSTGVRPLSQHGQENFHDEGSGASSFQRESSTSSTNSSDEEEGQMPRTPQSSNADEAPNVLEDPLEPSSMSSQKAANTVDDNDEESKPDDDESGPSVTSIYIDDAATFTPINDESALGGPSMDEEEVGPPIDNEDENIEEIIIEEVVEESETEVSVTEEGEPSETEGASAPPASNPQAQTEGEYKDPEAEAAEASEDPLSARISILLLSAPQPPSESPTKEERIPKTAEDVADDESNDPIFE